MYYLKSFQERFIIVSTCFILFSFQILLCGFTIVTKITPSCGYTIKMINKKDPRNFIPYMFRICKNDTSLRK